jgi:hypothetical protein
MATAAERTRASRQRRKDGGVLVSIDLEAAFVGRLVTLGWLAEGQQADRAAVGAAVLAFARRGWGISEKIASLYRPLPPPMQ